MEKIPYDLNYEFLLFSRKFLNINKEALKKKKITFLIFVKEKFVI
jgi:hypothetical protein